MLAALVLVVDVELPDGQCCALAAQLGRKMQWRTRTHFLVLMRVYKCNARDLFTVAADYTVLSSYFYVPAFFACLLYAFFFGLVAVSFRFGSMLLFQQKLCKRLCGVLYHSNAAKQWYLHKMSIH